jgi:Myb-like DNA-binding domain
VKYKHPDKCEQEELLPTISDFLQTLNLTKYATYLPKMRQNKKQKKLPTSNRQTNNLGARQRVKWSIEEIEALKAEVKLHGTCWKDIAANSLLHQRTTEDCRHKIRNLQKLTSSRPKT